MELIRMHRFHSKGTDNDRPTEKALLAPFEYSCVRSLSLLAGQTEELVLRHRRLCAFRLHDIFMFNTMQVVFTRRKYNLCLQRLCLRNVGKATHHLPKVTDGCGVMYVLEEFCRHALNNNAHG